MKHAEVKRDGYVIPLIGIDPEATVETCELCGKQFGLYDIELIGEQFMCKKCASEERT